MMAELRVRMGLECIQSPGTSSGQERVEGIGGLN
jgi:hypothetical protein